MSEMNLQMFDPIVAELNTLVKSSSQIVSVDFADKWQMEVVRTERIKLKNARVHIEKLGKEMRDDANKFSKAVIAKEKELIALIEPEEDRLQAFEEEAKAQQIRAERLALLPERNARLVEVGDWEQSEETNELILAMDNAQFDTFVTEYRSAKELAEQQAAQAQAEEAGRAEREKAEAAAREEKRQAELEAARLEGERKAKAEQAAADEAEKKRLTELSRSKRSKEFLTANGVTTQNKKNFYLMETPTGYILYERVAEFVN